MSDAPLPAFPSATKQWHSKAQPSGSPTRPELSAKGKSVIITGGGNTGIGGETARYFAQAGAARIALLGRREKPLLENKAWINDKFPGVEVITIPTDVTKQSDVDTAFSNFTGNGKINVLIHAAATAGPNEDVIKADGEKYLETVQTNVAGSLWVARAFVRHAAPDAVAVAINSWAAHWTVVNGFDAYCTAKAACWRLWDTVGIMHPNLSVFHTQPGVVLTEMNLASGGAATVKNVQIDDGKL